MNKISSISELINDIRFKKLFDIFKNNNADLRFVGGCVRDAIIGKKIKDIDLATDLLPAQVMKILNLNQINTIPTGEKFGTITAILQDISVEITSLREDISTDGRRAVVSFTNNWSLDAARRDFTINAISLNQNGKLFDYFGGLDDLKAGLIKFVGNAQQRIQEDYLRILRYFRFFANYSKTDFQPTIIKAIIANLAGIDILSGERLQSELFKIILNDPFITLSKMQEIQLLPKLILTNDLLISCLDPLIKLEKAHRLLPNIYRRLGLLTYGQSVEQLLLLVDRLKLSNKLKSYLLEINKLTNYSTDQLNKQFIKALIYDNKINLALDIILIRTAQGEDINLKDLVKLITTWSKPVLPINGKDLLSLGYPANQKIGQLLNQATKYWQNSDYQADKKSIIDFLKQNQIT